MAKKTGKHPILRALPPACADETKAVELLEALRWGDDPACPRCGDTDVRQMRDRQGNRNKRFLWRCYGCKRQFTVRIGTIFEESPIPLRIWLHAFWRMCASKKGVSALQLQRETGLGSYRSALFLAHRIRHVMSGGDDDDPKLAGTVEVDETFVGGKPRYRIKKTVSPITGWERQFDADPRPNPPKKAPVVALVERGGRVRARHIQRVDRETLGAAVREHVERGSTIYTDENPSYDHLSRDGVYGHGAVTHSKKEYVRGNVHTNTVEGFFALIKRGVYGTFHSVSKHHLHRYLDEFEFRYNHRKASDGERVITALRAADGKRLFYVAAS